jgi:hypothetical protein
MWFLQSRSTARGSLKTSCDTAGVLIGHFCSSAHREHVSLFRFFSSTASVVGRYLVFPGVFLCFYFALPVSFAVAVALVLPHTPCSHFSALSISGFTALFRGWVVRTLHPLRGG